LTNLVQDTAGNLYGAFLYGGIGRTKRNLGCGTIFELSPPSPGQTKWTEQTIFEFPDGAAGCGPAGGVILGPGGVLYGATGGYYSNIFELSPPANGGPWKETVLYSFTGGADGQGPGAPLLLGKGGALYGTTGGGGHSFGTVFELMPPQNGQTQWSEAVLYSFAGGNDGSNPISPLIADNSGALYGTTLLGGGCVQETSGCGTVFMLTPPSAGQTAWTETVLHAFTGGADGGNPSGGLYRDKSGDLFGNTKAGGQQKPCAGNANGCGTTYLLTPPANAQSSWTFQTLYAFTGQADGVLPGGPLVSATGGSVYGTAIGGVTGYGTVFELVPPANGQGTWSEDTVYNFPSGGKDGEGPQQGLLHVSGGAYVGTADGGPGIHSDGVVFQLKP
jgi:uncharacterized protein YceK